MTSPAATPSPTNGLDTNRPHIEGTNGIQAIDLIPRKVVRDQGRTADDLVAGQLREISAVLGG